MFGLLARRDQAHTRSHKQVLRLVDLAFEEAIVTQSIRCLCSRLNDPWRRFCGDCGDILQPGCRCGFANSRNDRYCGGCGSSLRISYSELTRLAPVPRTKTGRGIVAPCANERVSTQQIALLLDVAAVEPDT